MEIIGRDEELVRIAAFLATDGPRALLLEGEAGIGKTTLWRTGLELAEDRGYRVLACRPSASETAMSFSALRDLVDAPFDELADDLPAPQRHALGAALLRQEPGREQPQQGAVAVGVVELLRRLAQQGPLLIAIDDVQWLDASSATVIEFAARRLGVEPIGLLIARRADGHVAAPLDLGRSLSARLSIVPVGPLTLGALHRLVRQRTGTSFSRPTLRRIHESSGGNPFYALELARALDTSDGTTGEPLRLPESLNELLGERFAALAPTTADALFVTAAASQPTVELVEAALGLPADDVLSPAVDAAIVRIENARVVFTHPLLAAEAYDNAGPAKRRDVHKRLARLVDDLEERARHLALAADAPDEVVATALEKAAVHAKARGATTAAAELLERAAQLTPPSESDRRWRRTSDAGAYRFESGDGRHAAVLLEAVVSSARSGSVRALALARLAHVRSYDEQATAVDLFREAIAEAEGDRQVLATAHEGVAVCLFRLRERLDEAVEHASLATEIARELNDQPLEAEALGAKLLSEVLLGRESAAETARQTLALQSVADDRRVVTQPLLQAAVYWWWTDDLELARETFVRLLGRANELGDESSRPYILVLLGQVECMLGQLDIAAGRASEGFELAEQAGQGTLLAYHLALEGLADAFRGRVEPAREAVRRALEIVPATGGRPAELMAQSALGHLELTLDRPAETVQILEPVVAAVRREGMAEPGAMRFAVDLIEAFVGLGRLDEAEAELDRYETDARRLVRHSALASAGRCRGLLAAARGDLDGGIHLFERALEEHELVLLPLDRARTLLALGVAQRRKKERRRARSTLERARAEFDAIGAALWSGRVSAELARIGGRAPSGGALTPTERRVAELVAEGRPNKEVAGLMFVTPKTVEATLTRVYSKLGVHSRAELAHLLSSTSAPDNL